MFQTTNQILNVSNCSNMHYLHDHNPRYWNIKYVKPPMSHTKRTLRSLTNSRIKHLKPIRMGNTFWTAGEKTLESRTWTSANATSCMQRSKRSASQVETLCSRASHLHVTGVSCTTFSISVVRRPSTSWPASTYRIFSIWISFPSASSCQLQEHYMDGKGAAITPGLWLCSSRVPGSYHRVWQ